MVKSFLIRLVKKITDSLIGSGLLCGFITASTVGLGYFFVVSRFFINNKQKRVAAMTGFFMGQFVMFTSIYHGPIHEILVQPHNLIMIFVGSFLLQLFWTHLKTLRNTETEFLHPEVLNTIIRKRVLRLQLEFMLNFFVQLCNPYLEPGSIVPRFVSYFLFRYKNEKEILFIVTSVVGWLIGHIFFLILFRKLLQFIIHWVRNNFMNPK